MGILQLLESSFFLFFPLLVIWFFVRSTDEKENERPQDPLMSPGANDAISLPSSSGYYLNTSENSEYGRRNNTIPYSNQWQNGKSSGVGSFSGGKGEQKDKEKGQTMINYVVAPPQVRRIKHYSSNHRILLVGEGDFSFSTCLAAAFGVASNMIATSLDSQAFLLKNYQNALSNIVELRIRKCTVIHGVDATTMANHEFLGGIKFDRIIFNFPHAGFFKSLSRDDQLLLHRTLVSLFLKNAKDMLSENGEIHTTHKTNGFHKEWYLESIASSHQLSLIESVRFDKDEYPGYNTKYGFGGDNNFDCNPAKTYKFGLKSRVSY